MTFQLYTTPKMSGAHSIIRYRDGVYDLISPRGSDPNPRYYLECEGIPCDQKWARETRKFQLMAEASKAMYGAGQDIKIFEE